MQVIAALTLGYTYIIVGVVSPTLACALLAHYGRSHSVSLLNFVNKNTSTAFCGKHRKMQTSYTDTVCLITQCHSGDKNLQIILCNSVAKLVQFHD